MRQSVSPDARVFARIWVLYLTYRLDVSVQELNEVLLYPADPNLPLASWVPGRNLRPALYPRNFQRILRSGNDPNSNSYLELETTAGVAPCFNLLERVEQHVPGAAWWAFDRLRCYLRVPLPDIGEVGDYIENTLACYGLRRMSLPLMYLLMAAVRRSPRLVCDLADEQITHMGRAGTPLALMLLTSMLHEQRWYRISLTSDAAMGHALACCLGRLLAHPVFQQSQDARNVRQAASMSLQHVLRNVADYGMRGAPLPKWRPFGLLPSLIWKIDPERDAFERDLMDLCDRAQREGTAVYPVLARVIDQEPRVREYALAQILNGMAQANALWSSLARQDAPTPLLRKRSLHGARAHYCGDLTEDQRSDRGGGGLPHGIHQTARRRARREELSP